ncbi:hypothetical protein PG994_002681 [Apiospora phragmitis]|uniref:Uncharacterized protein n=1 Tax=Apiospora phragmitis TaxID=2905665 RepID=A0ABR1W9L3_9PEZI
MAPQSDESRISLLFDWWEEAVFEEYGYRSLVFDCEPSRVLLTREHQQLFRPVFHANSESHAVANTLFPRRLPVYSYTDNTTARARYRPGDFADQNPAVDDWSQPRLYHGRTVEPLPKVDPRKERLVRIFGEIPISLKYDHFLFYSSSSSCCILKNEFLDPSTDPSTPLSVSTMPSGEQSGAIRDRIKAAIRMPSEAAPLRPRDPDRVPPLRPEPRRRGADLSRAPYDQLIQLTRHGLPDVVSGVRTGAFKVNETHYGQRESSLSSTTRDT